MKNLFKLFFVALIAFASLSSCDESELAENPKPETSLTDLIGKVETRKASQEELSSIPKPSSNLDRVGCILGNDVQCGSEATSEVEYFIQNCTTYNRVWPPSGEVKTYYLGLSYYVDSDDDINLDHYMNNLQSHVTTAAGNGAAFISGDVISWPCSKGTNAGVIVYTVYK
ncbi:hypothetical protein [Fulvivirga ligni]|uniref:hypothetical protein n=1 Tax=Fulvivirga ligni TaxID=2904246 RepID=UPI001F3221AF|nr:hypothetical protein [Fulvivirga ligni]UII22064.1 hypothetical protein LVD16_02310 [Fulvivirga ligni]